MCVLKIPICYQIYDSIRVLIFRMRRKLRPLPFALSGFDFWTVLIRKYFDESGNGRLVPLCTQISGIGMWMTMWGLGEIGCTENHSSTPLLPDRVNRTWTIYWLILHKDDIRVVTQKYLCHVLRYSSDDTWSWGAYYTVHVQQFMHSHKGALWLVFLIEERRPSTTTPRHTYTRRPTPSPPHCDRVTERISVSSAHCCHGSTYHSRVTRALHAASYRPTSLHRCSLHCNTKQWALHLFIITPWIEAEDTVVTTHASIFTILGLYSSKS